MRRSREGVDGVGEGVAELLAAEHDRPPVVATLGDGGPATSALLANVGAVAVSPAGSLLVADGSDNRLRAISP